MPARQPVADREYLVVELGRGRVMTLVGSGITGDELVRVAERVEIDPAGLGWLNAV